MQLNVDITDSDLKAMLMRGSETAFDKIYERYWKKLFNEANKRLNDLELSEEIVQDIFIDLWVKREKKEIDNLYAYLTTAVRYQVYAIYNKRKNLPFFEEPLDHMAFSPDEADSECFQKELIAGINLWLNTQPEKRREIFRLRYLEDMSTKEISETLSISQKTVQNQLNLSQESLRESVSKFTLLILLVSDQL